MTICPNCKTENEDRSRYCIECGNDLTLNTKTPAQSKSNTLSTISNEKPSFKKKKIIIITILSLVLIIAVVFGILNSGYISFVTAYNMRQYGVAKSIQKWSFNSNTIKKHIKEFVEKKDEDYYTEYLNEEITYKEAEKNLIIPKCLFPMNYRKKMQKNYMIHVLHFQKQKNSIRTMTYITQY